MFDACGILPRFVCFPQLPCARSMMRTFTIAVVLLAAVFSFSPVIAQDVENEFGGGDEVVVEEQPADAGPAPGNADAGGNAVQEVEMVGAKATRICWLGQSARWVGDICLCSSHSR